MLWILCIFTRTPHIPTVTCRRLCSWEWYIPQYLCWFWSLWLSLNERVISHGAEHPDHERPLGLITHCMAEDKALWTAHSARQDVYRVLTRKSLLTRLVGTHLCSLSAQRRLLSTRTTPLPHARCIVTSGGIELGEDGGCCSERWWRRRAAGFGLRVAADTVSGAGADAPEQRAAGTPDRGDREHTQLPDLRRDQPAATGEKTTRLSASPLASRGASCLVITVF